MDGRSAKDHFLRTAECCPNQEVSGSSSQGACSSSVEKRRKCDRIPVACSQNGSGVWDPCTEAIKYASKSRPAFWAEAHPHRPRRVPAICPLCCASTSCFWYRQGSSGKRA